jgi:hypothetical protein
MQDGLFYFVVMFVSNIVWITVHIIETSKGRTSYSEVNPSRIVTLCHNC